MIERYTRPEMGKVWTLQKRFASMLKVEIAVAQAQAELRIIPRQAALQIAKKAKFQVEKILEIEKETKHDVIAFVSNVAENVGEHGRFVHFGMTSSDVLDTALSLQVQEAYEVLEKSLDRLEQRLKQLVRKHGKTLCAGRTHGMFAEPTTFGLKIAGFLAEFTRNRERIAHAVEQMKICKMSGAVGTYSGQPPAVEKKVAKRLGLKIETVATQVIPRDRHAELFCTLAIYASGLERLAVELRHLQRSEVAEVVEGFSKGQKGSSAMPHKKNPISAENITGLARLIRSYAQASLENVCLWHERDISHSSVERVIYPDAFILIDYMTYRMADLLSNLTVEVQSMKANVQRSRGLLFSSQVLLALVEKGLDRETAYRHVQRLSHEMSEKEHLMNKLLKDKELKRLLTSSDVRKIFQGIQNQKHVHEILQRVL